MTTVFTLLNNTLNRNNHLNEASDWLRNPYKKARYQVVTFFTETGYRLFSTQQHVSSARKQLITKLINRAISRFSAGYSAKIDKLAAAKIEALSTSSLCSTALKWGFSQFTQKAQEKGVEALSQNLANHLEPLMIELECCTLIHPFKRVGNDIFDLGILFLFTHGLHLFTPQMMEDHQIDPHQWLQNTLLAVKGTMLLTNLTKTTMLYRNYNQSHLKTLAKQLETRSGLSSKKAEILSYVLGDCLRKEIMDSLGVRYLGAFDTFLECKTSESRDLIQSIGNSLI